MSRACKNCNAQYPGISGWLVDRESGSYFCSLDCAIRILGFSGACYLRQALPW